MRLHPALLNWREKLGDDLCHTHSFPGGRGGTHSPPVLEVCRNIQLGSVNKPWIQTLVIRGPRVKGPGWLKWREFPLPP